MTLDTNILIAYLNGEMNVIQTVRQWRNEGRPLFVSTLSSAELLALPSLNSEQEEILRLFLQTFIRVPFDDRIAETTAALRRRYRLELPDAGIASTALEYEVPLVTRDRQFTRIPGLVIVQI